MKTKKNNKHKNNKIKHQYLYFWLWITYKQKRNNSNITTKTNILPVILCESFGMKRCLNTKTKSGLKAFGIKCNKQKNTPINGVLFNVKKHDLKKFDNREESYKKISIPLEFIHFIRRKIPKNSHIYTYMPVDSRIISKNDKNLMFCKYYLDLCIFGCLNYGKQFVEMFFNTTYMLPKKLSTYKNGKIILLININSRKECKKFKKYKVFLIFKMTKKNVHFSIFQNSFYKKHAFLHLT